MALSRDEIYTKVQALLVDCLGVDEEEVTPTARLSADLGAESIDYLDIGFRLEKAFPIKIAKGELFPEDIATLQNDPKFVQDGKITAEGMAEIKKRLPYTDYSEFEKDPTAEKAQDLVTVNMIINFVIAKLGQ